MKTRAITKMAFGALSLALIGAVPCIAQQVVSSTVVQAVDMSKTTPTEKTLLKKMEDIVQASRKAGVLDMKSVTDVLNSAAKSNVSDSVMGALVAMAAGAFPEKAPEVAAAATRSYGDQVKENHVRAIIASAAGAQERPYAAVTPISEAVEKALGNSPVAKQVPTITVEVAQQASDNPLNNVTAGGESSNQPGDSAAGGAMMLPGSDLPIGGTPFSPNPVSNPAGN